MLKFILQQSVKRIPSKGWIQEDFMIDDVDKMKIQDILRIEGVGARGGRNTA